MSEQLQLPTYDRTYANRQTLPRSLYPQEAGFVKASMLRELLVKAWQDGYYIFDITEREVDGDVLDGLHRHVFIDMTALARKREV